MAWLESRHLDSRKVNFDPHLLEYAEDMKCGNWSRERRAGKAGRPLAPSTINGRMDYAVDFLLWAASKELRDPFPVPTRSYSYSFATGTYTHASTKQGRVHAGRRRPDPINLRLPGMEELHSWIAEVERRKGYTKGLACRTILGSGIRRAEGAELPLTFLPMRRADWNVGPDGRVRFLLTDGTKGGKSRIVTIPLRLAEEIHRYRLTKRVWALAKWIKANPGEPKPARLFLGAYDGTPISAATIYDAWTVAGPFEGWSPHLGRHTWACYELLDALKSEATTAGFGPASVPVTWLESAAKTLMSIVITPNLGHVDERTTNTYLQWLRFQLTMPAAYSAWHEFLSAGNDNG